MAEELEVPVKGVEMEIEKGQGAVQITIAPMTEKSIRAIAAEASGGKLKVIIGSAHQGVVAKVLHPASHVMRCL